MFPLLVAFAVAVVPIEGVSIQARKLVLRLGGGVTKTVPAKKAAVEALLSPDRRVVAVVRGTYDVNGRVAKEELEVISVRGGEISVKRVDTEMPFVRDVAFLDEKRLAADVGGAHFAGTLILVDPETGAVKERFSVVAGTAQPEWVTAYERLRSR
jgi:hypothetical protein